MPKKKSSEEKTEVSKNPSIKSREEIQERLDALKERGRRGLTSFERIAIARHPNRPKTLDYIKNLCDEFLELSGDRLFRNDTAVVGGFATIGKTKCLVIGQEKGNDTESRLYRNFGMVHPEGFRKAHRLACLAEKFGLPVVFLVDTQGAYPGITAEERGQGWAIAHNLRELFRIKTPILVLIIGEGCSGGALGMGIGDAIGMLEHAYFSVISPEGCASILWRDPTKAKEASEALRLHAEDMLEFEIIEEVIKEEGGSHLNPEAAFQNARDFILRYIALLQKLPTSILLEKRYQKFRKIGSHILGESAAISEDPFLKIL